jgi:hypothetical protein
MSHRKTDLGIPPLQESAKVVLGSIPNPQFDTAVLQHISAAGEDRHRLRQRGKAMPRPSSNPLWWK